MYEYRPPNPSVTHSFRSPSWTPIKSGKYAFFPCNGKIHVLERTHQESAKTQLVEDIAQSE